MFQFARFTFVLVFMLLFVIMGTAQTADPSPTPTDAERRLQEEIDRLKQEKIKAELERDIRNARPQPTATPLDGSVTNSKDLKLEINLQTYRALRLVTDRIACDITSNISDPKPKVFVLYKAEIYQALTNYRAMQKPLNNQLETMTTDYDALLEEVGNIAALDGAAGISEFTFALRSLADLLALFRTNVEFNFVSVTINENALKSMISNSLRREKPCEKSDKSFSSVYLSKSTTIYDPDLFYPISGSDSKLVEKIAAILSRRQTASRHILIFDTQTAKSEAAKKEIETEEASITATKAKIQTKIEERIALETLRKKTRSPIKRAEIDEKIRAITEELTKLEGKRQESVAKKAKAENDKREADRIVNSYNKFAIAFLRQLNTEFTQFYTAITTRDASGQTPLSQLVKIEALADILDDSRKDSYWLSIKSVDAGGTTRVRKNLFRSFYYPDISVNGGSIVEYTLSRPSGEIIISNVNNAVQEFRKPGNIFRQNENDNKQK